MLRNENYHENNLNYQKLYNDLKKDFDDFRGLNLIKKHRRYMNKN